MSSRWSSLDVVTIIGCVLAFDGNSIPVEQSGSKPGLMGLKTLSKLNSMSAILSQAYFFLVELEL